MNSDSKEKLKEVASLFLKLGCIGFGGPAAHIALMQEEVVKKRKWITEQHFLDLIGATNLIPGPNSTEMTMHCGHERAGKLGLFVAGICFILPAAIITLFLAYLYQEYGELPTIQPFIFGIKPAIISIIIGAVYTLGKKAIKNIQMAFLGLFALELCLFGVNEIIALFLTGALGLVIPNLKRISGALISFQALTVLNLIGLIKIGSNTKVFFIFLKVGALLYGSGYVLFAFLQGELVDKGFLSSQQLVDAIAIGQFTPGPVFTAATFIGYQMNGWMGAAVATLGIFLPSFLFVWLLNPLIPKMRNSVFFSLFLDAVNVAAVAVIVSVLLEMGHQILVDWRAIVIALISLSLVLFIKKINSAYIVLGGAVAGYLLSLIS